MRKVVKCLIEGITDPDKLVKCVHTRTKNKLVRMSSVNPSMVLSIRSSRMLALYMEELELYRKQQEECLVKIMELCNESYAADADIALLTTIPGYSTVRWVGEQQNK